MAMFRTIVVLDSFNLNKIITPYTSVYFIGENIEYSDIAKYLEDNWGEVNYKSNIEINIITDNRKLTDYSNLLDKFKLSLVLVYPYEIHKYLSELLDNNFEKGQPSSNSKLISLLNKSTCYENISDSHLRRHISYIEYTKLVWERNGMAKKIQYGLKSYHRIREALIEHLREDIAARIIQRNYRDIHKDFFLKKNNLLVLNKYKNCNLDKIGSLTVEPGGLFNVREGIPYVGNYKIIEPKTNKYKYSDKIQISKAAADGKGTRAPGGLNKVIKIMTEDKIKYYGKPRKRLGRKVDDQHAQFYTLLWNRIYKGTGYDYSFYDQNYMFFPKVYAERSFILGSPLIEESGTIKEILHCGNAYLKWKWGVYQYDFSNSFGTITNCANICYTKDETNKTITYYPIDVDSIEEVKNKDGKEEDQGLNLFERITGSHPICCKIKTNETTVKRLKENC